MTNPRFLVLLLGMIGSVLLLQRAFDSSDHKKAERAVRSYTIGERSLGALVESEAPGGHWSTEITAGCRGVVRTSYDAPGARFEFDYDVPGHTIHPANEPGREALATLGAK